MKAVSSKVPRQNIKGAMKAVNNEKKKRDIKRLRSINPRLLYERPRNDRDRSWD